MKYVNAFFDILTPNQCRFVALAFLFFFWWGVFKIFL